MSKRALITGITGQDGTYLAQYLLEEGYCVGGLVRGQQNPKLAAVRKVLPDVELIEADLLDQSSLIASLELFQPDEVYNLGAVSFVPISWRQPTVTTEVTGLGALRLLEAVRIISGIGPESKARGRAKTEIRMYQASTSEMFGHVEESPQHERSRLHPRSPYGVAKVYAHLMTQNYRESYDMFAVSGILFNHESPRRGSEFVTRKVSIGVAKIKLGMADELLMGNLDARRDWGHAADYVRAMHAMLGGDEPKDYVIGTGISRTIRELLDTAFGAVGLNWRRHVRQDPNLIRPAEVDLLCADPSMAMQDLSWKPQISFEEMIHEMVETDIRRLIGTARGFDLLGCHGLDSSAKKTGPGSGRAAHMRDDGAKSRHA